ncbi:hypothetical protein LCGC14_2596800 [marine sediment metagenome]|uniref:Uncharacterized protein n=1 Tax=marine sediment metagenome TaxID=412755 RepID=A0A0F9AXV5_9ZZZZ
MTTYICDRCKAHFNQAALDLDGRGEYCPICGSPVFSLAGIRQTFEIPLPPSANRMYRSERRGGRKPHPSTEYLAWVRSLGWWLKIQAVIPQPAPVRFSLVVKGGKGWRISADIDNRIKPTLDGLVKNRILDGDSTAIVKQEELIYVERESRTAIARCFVRLEAPIRTWFDTWTPGPSPTAEGAERQWRKSKR